MLERADKLPLSHLKVLDLILGQQVAAGRDRALERFIPDTQDWLWILSSDIICG